MEKETNREIEKIVVVYDDGSTKEITKGCAWNLPEDEVTDPVELCLELVNCGGKDLEMIVSSAIQLGMQLGMFREDDDGGYENETGRTD